MLIWRTYSIQQLQLTRNLELYLIGCLRDPSSSFKSCTQKQQPGRQLLLRTRKSGGAAAAILEIGANSSDASVNIDP